MKVIKDNVCDYPGMHYVGCYCKSVLLLRGDHIKSNCWTCTTELANDMHSYDPIQKEIVSLKMSGLDMYSPDWCDQIDRRIK